MGRSARWLLVLTLIAGCGKRTGETVMANPAEMEIASDIDDLLLEKTWAVDVKPVEIRPASQTASPLLSKAAPPKSGRGSPRPYFNESLNSRAGGEIGQGRWDIRWKAALQSGLNPGQVLQAGDRIVLPGEYEWQLFDLQGKSIATGGRGAGEVVLDAARGRFYVPESSGTLGAVGLADGQTQFAMSLFSGKNFRRSLILPHGDQLLAVSVEYVKQPHSDIDPSLAAIEVFDLSRPAEINQYGSLISAEVKARLVRSSTLLLAAARGDTVVIAVDDRIFLTDWNLKPKAVLTGKFTPVSISLDEETRIYMIHRAEGKQALWIISPRGERLLAYDFASDFPPITTPVAIGYDHRAYIAASERLAAISPDGQEVWKVSTPGRQPRIAVVGSGDLLVSGGNEIIAVDAEGEARSIFTFEKDRVVTAPVMTEDGGLLIASPTQLYCLARR